MSFNAYNIRFRRESGTLPPGTDTSDIENNNTPSPTTTSDPINTNRSNSPARPPPPSTERSNPFDDLVENEEAAGSMTSLVMGMRGTNLSPSSGPGTNKRESVGYGTGMKRIGVTRINPESGSTTLRGSPTGLGSSSSLGSANRGSLTLSTDSEHSSDKLSPTEYYQRSFGSLQLGSGNANGQMMTAWWDRGTSSTGSGTSEDSPTASSPDRMGMNDISAAFSRFSFPDNNNSNKVRYHDQQQQAHQPVKQAHLPSHLAEPLRRPSVAQIPPERYSPPLETHRSSVPNIVINAGSRNSSESVAGSGGSGEDEGRSGGGGGGGGAREKASTGRITPKPSRLSLRVGQAKDLFSPAGEGNFRSSKIWPSGSFAGSRLVDKDQRQDANDSGGLGGKSIDAAGRQDQEGAPQPPTSRYKLAPPKINHVPTPSVELNAKAQMIEKLTDQNKDVVVCSDRGSFALPSPVFRALRGEQGGYDSPSTSTTSSPTSAVGSSDWISNAPDAERLSPSYKSSSTNRLQPGSGSPGSSGSGHSSPQMKRLPTPPTSPMVNRHYMVDKGLPSPPVLSPNIQQQQSRVKPPTIESPQVPTPSQVNPAFLDEQIEGPTTPSYCVAQDALRNHQLDETFLSLYHIRDELGSGGFGFVCSAWSVAEQCEVAVKFIYKDRLHHKAYVRDWHRRQSAVGILPGYEEGQQQQSGMRTIPMEAALLQYCNHPNIVAFKGLYEDKTFFYLVQELHGSPWSKTHIVTIDDISITGGTYSTGLTASTSGLDSVPGLAASESTSTMASSSSLATLPDIDRSNPTLTPSLSGDSIVSTEKEPLFPRISVHAGQPYEMGTLKSSETGQSPYSDPGLARPGLMQRRSSHDLFERIETQDKFSEREAQYVFAQVVDAVAWLHRNGICHRDIKDENIVIDDDMTVKLIDFGSAVIYDPRREAPYYTRFYGTINFASSEIIQGYPYQAAPAEIWSLGVLLAILLTGVPPFDSPQSAANGNIRLKRPQAISYEALDLIKKCLNLDVANRITIEGVKRHRWLTSVGLRDGKSRGGYRPAEPMGFRPVAHDGHRHGHE